MAPVTGVDLVTGATLQPDRAATSSRTGSPGQELWNALLDTVGVVRPVVGWAGGVLGEERRAGLLGVGRVVVVLRPAGRALVRVGEVRADPLLADEQDPVGKLSLDGAG